MRTENKFQCDNDTETDQIKPSFFPLLVCIKYYSSSKYGTIDFLFFLNKVCLISKIFFSNNRALNASICHSQNIIRDAIEIIFLLYIKIIFFFNYEILLSELIYYNVTKNKKIDEKHITHNMNRRKRLYIILECVFSGYTWTYAICSVKKCVSLKNVKEVAPNAIY